MHAGGQTGGYTIVETIVFLLISSLLFIVFTSTFSGRQATVEFTQATRDAQAQIQRIINEVASGFYPANPQLTCVVSGTTPPSFIASPSEQGSNSDCVFMGKAIHFGRSEEREFHTISIAGRRLRSADRNDVSSLQEALPVTIPGVSLTSYLRGRLFVTRIVAPDFPGQRFGTVVFLTSLPRYQTQTNTLASGATRVSYGVIPGTSLQQVLAVAEGSVSTMTDPAASNPNGRTPIIINPSRGIYICFADNEDPARSSPNRKAMLIVGEGSSQTTARLETGNYRQDICEG